MPIALPQLSASPARALLDGRPCATPFEVRQDRFLRVPPVLDQLPAAVPGPEGDAVEIQVQPPWIDPRQNCCRNLANLSASEAKPWVSLIG